MRILPATLLILGATLLPRYALADPAPPNKYDCLRATDQWTEVRGKWSIDGGEFKCRPAGFDKIAVFSDKELKLPAWHAVSLTAKGLEKAQERYVGIVVDYQDDSNYRVCSFEFRGPNSAIVKLTSYSDGVQTSVISVPVKCKLADSVGMSVETYSAERHSRITVGLAGRGVIVSFSPGRSISRRFGICLKSSNVVVSKCTVSGVASS